MDPIITFLTAHKIPLELAVVVAGSIGVGAFITFVSLLVMLLIWAERRIAGRMQARYGPDALYQALFAASVALIVLNIHTKGVVAAALRGEPVGTLVS